MYAKNSLRIRIWLLAAVWAAGAGWSSAARAQIGVPGLGGPSFGGPGGSFGGPGGSFGGPGAPSGGRSAGSGLFLQPGGATQLAQGSRQGGFLPGGGGIGGSGIVGLAPGATVQVAALCTDLLSDPPDATTRFTEARGTQVALADGAVASLSEALQEGLLTLRGRHDTFDPIRRDGSLALDLYLVNVSRQPLRVALQPGTTFTPQGQPEQALPEGAARLPVEAARRGIASLNTLQFAVWAARGSTAEEVEQANLFRLPASEGRQVQELLTACGIDRQFDRERGAAEKRYVETAKKLGSDSEDVAGTTYLCSGYQASVTGERNADGWGVVTIHPLRYGGEFRYGARFQERKDGRVRVRLFNLANGRPAHANRGELLLTPDAV